MADFGSPIAQNVNPVGTGIQTLSGVLGIKQQQQALQGQAAQVQQEQQTARQRAGIAGFMQNFDPTSHIGPDGTLDLNSVLADPKLRQAAGDQFPAVMQQMLAVKENQLQAKQQLVNLNDVARKQFQGMLGGLRTDPDVIQDNEAGRQKVQTAIGQFAATGPDAARIANIYGQVVNHVPQGKLSGALSNFQLQAMDAGAQASAQAPQYTSTGAQLVQTNPQAAGGAPSGNLGVSLPPGMQTFQDQAGNTWAFNPQNPGQAHLVGHGGGQQSGTGGAPPPQAPPTLGVGSAANITASAQNDEQAYSQIRDAANQGPVTKNILQAISTLAGQSKTGLGSKDIANAEAVISQYLPGFKAAGDAATNRQLLGKYVEQLALRTAEANGVGTDSARAQVASAIPDPEHMTPEAIKKASQFINSQIQISQARGAVAEKYRQEHNGSSQGLRAVDSNFMQNMDPRAFDYVSLPKEQRAQFLQQNFPDQAARERFAQQLSVIDHMGGFNYARPTGGASGAF